MTGCKVVKRAIVMDRLHRKDKERLIKTVIGAIRSSPKVKRAKSVDLNKTNQDIALNLSLFFALNALLRSVHDFAHCPSWKARSQQEPLSHPTFNSQNC